MSPNQIELRPSNSPAPKPPRARKPRKPRRKPSGTALRVVYALGATSTALIGSGTALVGKNGADVLGLVLLFAGLGCMFLAHFFGSP